MKQHISRFFFLMAAMSIIVMFSLTCGTRDDRDRVRADFGEPDEVVTQGVDPFWRETWLYNDAGAAFEFHRTSGCGSLRDVFLYRQYAFVPTPGDSTTVKIVPLPAQQPGNPLSP